MFKFTITFFLFVLFAYVAARSRCDRHVDFARELNCLVTKLVNGVSNWNDTKPLIQAVLDQH